MTDKVHKSVEEFSVRTLEIGGLGAALKALRLPFGKDARSDIADAVCATLDDTNPEGIFFCTGMQGRANHDDLKLISTLVKRGDEHAKVLRGVCVWCEINAPRYFWQECDRYSVGACCLSSNSTMHQQGRGLDEDSLVEMKENLTEGTMQKRVWMFSYQTLRRIYFQRRDHRLPQWRKFCEWIKTLPFADEFITAENERHGNNTDQ